LHGGSVYGEHAFDVLYYPPVTAPFFFNQFQAFDGLPPLQLPQVSPQQDNIS